MASLNTLRTKYGIIVSVVIILALLAFIISLGPEMGFGSNDPKVGEINGDKISYSEYLNEYETVKSFTGASESTEAESDALATATWRSLITKHLFTPSLQQVGLDVTEQERMAMISGEHLSQAYYTAFADPTTGAYDVQAVTSFLAQVSTMPEYQSMWSFMNEQAVAERLMSKYMGLVKAGTYANKLEVAQGVTAANESRNGRMVVLPYTNVDNASVEITDAEINNYFNAHKHLYTKAPYRAISYVVFDVEPTSDDMLEIENKAKTMGEEFAAAEDIRAFIRKNMGNISTAYATADQLAEDEKVLLNGEQYGPVLKGNEWVMSRAVDTKMAPDSLGLSHIVLDATQTELIDSLYTALQGGADFAEAARAHSSYAASAELGGEIGVVPFSALTPELAEPLATAKKGDVVKVTVSGVTQLIKVTRADAAKKHVLVGSIAIPVEASSATRRDVHNIASIFSVDGKGSLDNFNAAASAAAVTPRVARVSQGERSIVGLDNSHEVVRWAYGADVQEISEIFTLGNSYVVAMLTGIDDTEYMAVSDVSEVIRETLMRDKKFEVLKAKLAGSNIDEVAKTAGVEVTPFTNVKMNDYGVAMLPLEPHLAGSIANTTATGQLSVPVKGYSNAVVFVVDEITKSETQTADAEKVRQMATLENNAYQLASIALQNMGEIEDLRGQYF
ncbi:MAG: SurA N-terminal domain-containing protein [Alistipes sp.]|nr:SurA N-terminal domain-containing protein [Alistipes sp.]